MSRQFKDGRLESPAGVLHRHVGILGTAALRESGPVHRPRKCAGIGTGAVLPVPGRAPCIAACSIHSLSSEIILGAIVVLRICVSRLYLHTSSTTFHGVRNAMKSCPATHPGRAASRGLASKKGRHRLRIWFEPRASQQGRCRPASPERPGHRRQRQARPLDVAQHARRAQFPGTARETRPGTVRRSVPGWAPIQRSAFRKREFDWARVARSWISDPLTRWHTQAEEFAVGRQA